MVVLSEGVLVDDNTERSDGYAPNAIAHSLATQRSNIIGFIGSETQNYWYQENIQTLARQITLARRQMMLFQVMTDGTIEDVVPDMIQYRLSGCIVIPAVAMTPGSAEKLQKFGTTVVMMNRAPVGGACEPDILVAVRFGHRINIAALNPPPSRLATGPPHRPRKVLRRI